MPLRLAWFATARGTSSRLLFRATCDAIRSGRLDAEIVCVVCNRNAGQAEQTDSFLAEVTAAGVPLISESSRDWRRRVGGARSVPGADLAAWRRDFDRRLLERMEPFKPDAAMLAGYMLILSEVICDAVPCLNLHPALPDGPIGTWQQVIHELIRQRADRSGLVLQRVTRELDRGPTVTWAQYPIRGPQFDPLWDEHGDTTDWETPLFQAIRRAGASREPAFIIQSLQAVADDRSLLAGAATADGVEISEAVERALSLA